MTPAQTTGGGERQRGLRKSRAPAYPRLSVFWKALPAFVSVAFWDSSVSVAECLAHSGIKYLFF